MTKNLDHDVLLRWRTQLTDLEIDTFIPLFRTRLEAFGEIFEKMLVVLRQVRVDQVYLSIVERVLNPANLPTPQEHVPAGLNYCNEIERIIATDFIARISLLKSDLLAANDFRTFSKFVNLLDQLCASIIQNRANLFLMSLRPYVHVIDHVSKKVITTPPVEYAMILRPFDVWLDNLDQIARGTSGTVENWRKTQTDWKTKYLAFRANEESSKNSSLVLKINVTTVLLAISLSLVFLFFPDIFGLRKENAELKTEVRALKESVDSANKEILNLRRIGREKKS